MKMAPMNFLTVELLTILYPLFLLHNHTYPLVMLLIIIVHGFRLEQNIKQVNKEFQPNFQIFVLYIILTIGLFYSKQFVLFGILFGLLQYLTYQQHEQITKQNYNWLELWIDVPITIMSSWISYQGFKTKNLLLAPFLGDVVYHVLEFYHTK